MNAFSPLATLDVRTADLSDPAERGRLDAFVQAQPEASPFHTSAWSLGVQRGCGQRAHYLLAEHGKAIAGVLPLTEVRSPLFGSALVSAGFGVGGGVLGQGEAVLAEAALALARRLSVSTVELRGGPVPPGWTAREGTYAGFARALPATDEAILKAIPRKQRAEVRRAQGFGLSVRHGRTARDLADHYRVYSESVRNLGTPVFPRALFDAMLDEYGTDADILTISKEGQPIASVLTLYDKGTAYPYWGGGTTGARASRANEMMYYELMRHAARRGCTRFDFGRSKFGTGAFAFKKNWGFEPQPLTYAFHGEARKTNPMSPKYRLQVALWKKLPLWAANRVGPLVARGLG